MSPVRIIKMSTKYQSLGELRKSLGPVPQTPTHYQNVPTIGRRSKQTILPFSRTTTQTHINPYQQSTIPPINPDSEPPETNNKISFQHRFSNSFNNDFDWLGIKIHCKRKNTARLWSQNINGIKRNNNFLQFAENVEALTQYEIDFFAFTETNLNSSNAYVRDSIAAISSCVLPSSRHIMSSTVGHPYSENFQFGGTLSISSGVLSPRVATIGHDKYGRYTWTQYFGKKHHLKIYNI